jgi:hypothetical protein
MNYWIEVIAIPALLFFLGVATGFYMGSIRKSSSEQPQYVSFDEKVGRDAADFGTAIHSQMTAYHSSIGEVERPWRRQDFGEVAHPGRQCGPQCWRKPNGHRWETS